MGKPRKKPPQNPSPTNPDPNPDTQIQPEANAKQNQVKVRSNRSTAGVSTIELTQEVHSGPIPHPSLLAGYETICPGAANRILKQAELEQLHRHTRENNEQRIDEKLSEKGMLFAFILASLIVLVGLVIALCKDPWAGTTFGGVSMVSLVGVFMVRANRAVATTPVKQPTKR